MILRDDDVSIGDWDRKFLLCTTVAVVIVLSVIGLATILVAWMQPSSYPDGQGLFYPSDLDFDALGYSPDEFGTRSTLSRYLGLCGHIRLHGHRYCGQADRHALPVGRRRLIRGCIGRGGGAGRCPPPTADQKTLSSLLAPLARPSVGPWKTQIARRSHSFSVR